MSRRPPQNGKEHNRQREEEEEHPDLEIGYGIISSLRREEKEEEGRRWWVREIKPHRILFRRAAERERECGKVGRRLFAWRGLSSLVVVVVAHASLTIFRLGRELRW